MTPQRLAAAAAVAVLLLAPLGAYANHPVSAPSGGTVTFREKTGGNEWWVEVYVTASGTTVRGVDVMDDGGQWAPMTYKPEWGTWAASYHIEPGHRVTFLAHTSSGDVPSCPFAHPSAVEQCQTTPPAWTMDDYATVPEYGHDMATGDTDGDGLGEVYVATMSGLYEGRPEAPGTQVLSSMADFTSVVVGDLDRDGKGEVYGSRYNQVSSWEIHQFTRTSTGWASRLVFLPAPGEFLGRMSVGDLDRDGTRDLYVSGTAGMDGAVYQLRPTATGPFQATIVLRAHDAESSISADWNWIGDADRDGQAELVTMVAGRGYSHIWMVDYTTTWVAVDVGATNDFPGPIVAGDVDGDGKGEIATLGLSTLDVWTLVNGAWSRSTVLSFGIGQDLFLGDGDNDGRQELYVIDEQEVILVRKVGTSWTTQGIATLPEWGDRVIVGDGDRDGLREVFALWFDADVRVSHIARIQLPASGFDATFTGVRGNEWWVQAMVSGNGQGVARVDVRINEGAWQPLAKKSWGGWAASYHIVQGSVVQLRALSSSGAVDLSSCYRWIPASGTDAQTTSCPGDGGEAFDATFTNVKGNEYWLEAVVTANKPVNAVFAYIGSCSSEPADLVYRADWGKWVLGDTRIPSGTKVVLEAHGEGGSERSGGYIWPGATPTSGC